MIDFVNGGSCGRIMMIQIFKKLHLTWKLLIKPLDSSLKKKFLHCISDLEEMSMQK